MSNQELITRYVYAATKDLPAAMREDVARELESLVDDMLAARCGENLPGTTDVKAILAEIGAPDEVYARYSPDGGKSLIGPPYFAKYKAVLKVVLYCVGFSMLALGLVSLLVTQQSDFWGALSGWLGSIASSLVYGFAAVTILFAVLQRKNVPVQGSTFDFDSLPTVPAKGNRISLGDSIAEIILNVAFTVLFIFFPQIFSFYWNGVGGPVFNVALLQGRWPLLVIACVLGLGATCFGMFEGRYTLRYAFITLATNIVSFVVMMLFLTGPNMINPDFLTAIASRVTSANGLALLSNINLVLIGIIALAMVLDTATTFGKAVRSKE